MNKFFSVSFKIFTFLSLFSIILAFIAFLFTSDRYTGGVTYQGFNFTWDMLLYTCISAIFFGGVCWSLSLLIDKLTDENE